jgi:hypothetical protein
MFISNKIDSNLIEDLITKCSVHRDNDAPIWKNLIVNTVDSYSDSLLSH